MFSGMKSGIVFPFSSGIEGRWSKPKLLANAATFRSKNTA